MKVGGSVSKCLEIKYQGPAGVREGFNVLLTYALLYDKNEVVTNFLQLRLHIMQKRLLPV